MNAARKFGHRYPWERWLAAPLPLVLRRGTDFPAEVMPSSLAVMLRLRVLERGLRRTIRVREDRVEMGPKTDFRGCRAKTRQANS